MLATNESERRDMAVNEELKKALERGKKLRRMLLLAFGGLLTLMVAAGLESFDWIKKQSQWPVAVIYKTHKGKGISFMEDNAHWHGAPIDDATHAKARQELLRTLEALP